MTLIHESDLDPYQRTIGGSAGKRTHGGTDIDPPAAMPTAEEADAVVSTRDELLSAIAADEAVVMLDPEVGVIDLSGVSDATIGANATLVGHYCNPEVPGYGPLLVQSEYIRRTFRTRNSATLIGVAFLGPLVDAEYRAAMRADEERPTEHDIYFDPRDRDGFPDDWYATGVFCFGPKFSVTGCFFAGWPLAGIEIGAKNHETTGTVERSSFVDCLLETMGYGVQHYNGELSVRQCYFDRCRHGLSSFGYPTGGWAQMNTVYGSGLWAGHAADMHDLASNIPVDTDVAGKYANSYRCTFMCTEDIDGTSQEGIAIRGVPEELSYVDKCHFYGPEPDPENPNVQGTAWRQERSSLTNFEDRGCVYGTERVEGYGAPLRPDYDPDVEQPENPDAERVARLESEVSELKKQVDKDVTELKQRFENVNVQVSFDPPGQTDATPQDEGGDGS